MFCTTYSRKKNKNKNTNNCILTKKKKSDISTDFVTFYDYYTPEIVWLKIQNFCKWRIQMDPVVRQ